MQSNNFMEKFSRYTPALNVLWSVVLLSVIGGALFIQFFIGDLPCRLCMWQRMAMMLITAVLLANIKFGQSMHRYGLIIIFAIFGASVSLRQILAYIPPDNPGYGPAVFGLHTYTWAFLVFACSILASACMLILNNLHGEQGVKDIPQNVIKGLIVVAMAIALTLSVATLFQCGLDVCPGAKEYMFGEKH